DQASRLNRIQAASAGGVRACIRRVAGCATPTGSAGHAGATANLKLTFHLDHSAGADQEVAVCCSNASERCPRAWASSRVRSSSCFFNSMSELGPLLTRALAFVPVERSLRPRVGLFAPLRAKVTSSAQALINPNRTAR